MDCGNRRATLAAIIGLTALLWATEASAAKYWRACLFEGGQITSPQDGAVKLPGDTITCACQRPTDYDCWEEDGQTGFQQDSLTGDRAPLWQYSGSGVMTPSSGIGASVSLYLIGSGQLTYSDDDVHVGEYKPAGDDGDRNDGMTVFGTANIIMQIGRASCRERV